MIHQLVNSRRVKENKKSLGGKQNLARSITILSSVHPHAVFCVQCMSLASLVARLYFLPRCLAKSGKQGSLSMTSQRITESRFDRACKMLWDQAEDWPFSVFCGVVLACM